MLNGRLNTLSANSVFSKEISEKMPILSMEINEVAIDNIDIETGSNVIEYEPIVSECPICFNDNVDTDMWIVFECKHSICLQCLEKIYHHRGKKQCIECPICRSSIEVADFLPSDRIKTIDNQLIRNQERRRRRQDAQNTANVSLHNRTARQTLNARCCIGITTITTCIFLIWLSFYDP